MICPDCNIEMSQVGAGKADFAIVRVDKRRAAADAFASIGKSKLQEQIGGMFNSVLTPPPDKGPVLAPAVYCDLFACRECKRIAMRGRKS